ncbi:MAG: 30S ribosomal protein S5 [Planctomycetota bacterium]
MRDELDYLDPDAEDLDLMDRVIKINRSAKVMKGGRRFGFSALVVLGNGRGVVGLGFGKAREVPPSVEKGVADARKHLVRVSLVGTTFPHAVVSEYRSSIVKLIPAAPGTGIIAGAAVRSVLEAAGVKDALTKAMGSKNMMNLAKATFQGLVSMRTRKEIEALRGVSVR